MEAGPAAVLDRRLARRGIVLAATAATAFVAIFAAIHPLDHATALDESVATWIAAHRSPTLVDAANVASLAGRDRPHRAQLREWTTDVSGGFALGTCWLGAVYAWRSATSSPPSSQIR